jgi:hypothetical protein
VNHGSGGGLVWAFKRPRGGGEEKIYTKLVEEKEFEFLVKGWS